jgi:hypothetical protein
MNLFEHTEENEVEFDYDNIFQYQDFETVENIEEDVDDINNNDTDNNIDNVDDNIEEDNLVEDIHPHQTIDDAAYYNNYLHIQNIEDSDDEDLLSECSDDNEDSSPIMSVHNIMNYINAFG